MKNGGPPYHPRMMVKVLLYGYCTGVASSRRIAQRLREDIAFRVLAANRLNWTSSEAGPSCSSPAAIAAARYLRTVTRDSPALTLSVADCLPPASGVSPRVFPLGAPPCTPSLHLDTGVRQWSPLWRPRVVKDHEKLVYSSRRFRPLLVHSSWRFTEDRCQAWVAAPISEQSPHSCRGYPNPHRARTGRQFTGRFSWNNMVSTWGSMSQRPGWIWPSVLGETRQRSPTTKQASRHWLPGCSNSIPQP